MLKKILFYNNMTKKPKFMCVITSNFNAVAKDPETGIYILPITSLSYEKYVSNPKITNIFLF